MYVEKKFGRVCIFSVDCNLLRSLEMANPSDPKSHEENESKNKKEINVSSKTPSEVDKSDKTTANDDSTCFDDYKDLKLPDDDDIEGEFELKDTENDMSESEGINVWPSLSSSNISVDARALRVPRRRHKGTHKLQDKLGDEEHELKEGLDFDKELEKVSKTSKEEKIQSMIKMFVHRNSGTVKKFKFYDAAIVYDKKDFEDVSDFKEDLIVIAQKEVKEDLRIELFDSEEFAQSKIKVVEDVMKKCSVVFLYLTANFSSSAENILFTEEAIGISRLGLGTVGSQNPWVLKPVHTLPRKSRTYETPVGLLTVYGIDWFDRSSSHTVNQIVTTLKTAILQRKQRETEVNTSQNYEHVFGRLPVMPPLGPPYNKPRTMPHFSFPGEHKHHWTAPMDPPPSYSQFTQAQLSFRNDPTAIQMDTQPSITPDLRNALYGDTRQQYVPQNRQFESFSPHHQRSEIHSQSSLGYRNQEHTNISYERPPPYTRQAEQQPVAHQISGQPLEPPFTHGVPIHQPRSHGMQANQLPGHVPTNQASRMHGVLSTGAPAQTDLGQHQILVQHGTLDAYRSQPMSRDAFQSEPVNFTVDQRIDTQDCAHLSVVSQVSEDLITKSNLSADDDVEVDTRSLTGHSVGSREARPKLLDCSDDSEESTDESEYSSDSDSDIDYESKRKVVKKVVNIVGCKTVQLGKGNTVKESDKKPDATDGIEASDKLSNKQIETFNSSKDVKLPTTNEGNLRTVGGSTAMNLSVSEDNMSEQNILSRDSNNRAANMFSMERTNLLSGDLKMIKSFEPEKTDKEKIKTKLKVSIERDNFVDDRTMKANTVYSPDDNISEEELFGNGTMALDTNSTSRYDTCESSITAPFSFSQGILQTKDLRHILHSSLTSKSLSERKLDSNTVENNDVD